MTDNAHLQLIVNEVVAVLRECYSIYTSEFRVVRGELNPKTSIDEAVDERLQSRLPQAYSALYLSEETFSTAAQLAGWRWIVDPVDGTENLLLGSRRFATSVALINPEGQCVLGVVHAPLLQKTYSAIRGMGAVLNDERLAKGRNVGRRVLSMAFPNRGPTITDRIGRQVASLLRSTWTIRASGSAGLDICDVARGRWAAFFEESTYLWDVGAATLIAQEAGCVASSTATDFTPADPHVRGCIVAATGEFLAELEEILGTRNNGS